MWERIHLPVATRCNVKCRFCDQSRGSACHSSRPGYAERTMGADEAAEVVRREITRRPCLRIVAVSGPGDPLANNETFDLLEALKDLKPWVEFCLSTNGVLLRDRADILRDLGVTALSVSISTVTPSTASRIYEWADLDGRRVRGIDMGTEIVRRQIEGIVSARRAGIHVKANTILIPSLNGTEISHLAHELHSCGAEIQNIVPLIPSGDFRDMKMISDRDIGEARGTASTWMRQFVHCAQCRSDVVGIPGCDCLL